MWLLYNKSNDNKKVNENKQTYVVKSAGKLNINS